MKITGVNVKMAFIKDGCSYLSAIGMKNPGGCPLEFSLSQDTAMSFGNKKTAMEVRDVLDREGYFTGPCGKFFPDVVEETVGKAIF